MLQLAPAPANALSNNPYLSFPYLKIVLPTNLGTRYAPVKPQDSRIY